MPSQIALGPILYIGRCAEDVWRFRIGCLVNYCDDQCPYEVKALDDGMRVHETTVAARFDGVPGSQGRFFQTEVEIQRGVNDRRVGYELTAKAGEDLYGLREPITVKDVCVPAAGQLPEIAFFSCSGFSDPKVWRTMDEDPHRLWHDVAKRHSEKGLHLLIGGGDQIYCDSIWDRSTRLSAYRELPRSERVRLKAPKDLADKTTASYISLYEQRWERARPVGHMLMRVPGVFTWDDHDIFDGWGSYTPDEQEAGYFKAVFEAARRTFEAFQVGGREGSSCLTKDGAYLQATRFEAPKSVLDVLLLDVRSDRTRTSVMSDAQWAALDQWLEDTTKGRAQDARVRHLLVVSAVPLLYMRFPGLLSELPLELQDDLIDQWEDKRHRGERIRLIMTLLRHAKASKSCITLLSGDVHVGARGRIRSTAQDHLWGGASETIIEQITSSGIVHQPPNAFEWWAVRAAGHEGPEDLPGEVSTELIRVGADRYLHDRNWLTISADAASKDKGRLWIQWQVKDGPVEPKVVIRPA